MNGYGLGGALIFAQIQIFYEKSTIFTWQGNSKRGNWIEFIHRVRFKQAKLVGNDQCVEKNRVIRGIR